MEEVLPNVKVSWKSGAQPTFLYIERCTAKTLASPLRDSEGLGAPRSERFRGFTYGPESGKEVFHLERN